MAAIARTIIVLLFLGGATVAVYWKLADDAKQRTINELKEMNDELDRRLAAREKMIDRLQASRRVGHIRVVEQEHDPDGAIARTTLEWIELDDEGKAIAQQTITVPGETIYFDAWSIKFPKDDIAEGHPLRGRTLLLLRRVYSEKLTPENGVPIDTPGAVPPAYAVTEMALMQQNLWAHFWELATDPKYARTVGVRVAQGEAVYKPVRTGQIYELALDAAGGMSMIPIEETDVLRAVRTDVKDGAE